MSVAEVLLPGKRRCDCLESVRGRLEKHGLRVTLHSHRGRPDAVLAEVAREIGSQLIITGTRGNIGLSNVLLGSMAVRTLRAGPTATVVVRDGTGGRAVELSRFAQSHRTARPT